MASAKRKQDEKNLKILRELVSLPGNKECFDCHQRGPTYVNMTIGSFVCTSCSGMLRGLTPPHRVKSISMAVFSQDEIEFIKERGNEYCRRIWLGLMNSSDEKKLDTKDEQRMKDLMSAKYESKQYYLDPSISNQNVSAKHHNSHQTSIPRVPNSGVLTALSSEPSKSTNANNVNRDFVADFSKISDPFQSSVSIDNRINQPIAPQPFFANFDNNPIFNNTQKNSELLGSLNNSSGGNSFSVSMDGTKPPPSEDRYAALKDLDSLMKQAQLKESTTATLCPSSWNGNNANETIWGGNRQITHVISNPFTTNELWCPTTFGTNNNVPQVDNSIYNSPANPFKPVQLAVTNENQWMGIGGSNNENVIQFSQIMTPLANKVWHPTIPGYHANPFMVPELTT
ncbi:arf-GAP domain and FG repeat-containing protein 1 isoform X2 [Prorops nasuta]|uniref:arf-GAP domain and FG repeat-containing protein 1 isoform X2 n=1 Tax=Prorops nasuta TaxID=863751 RepID=UPI0034CF616E